MDYAKGTAPRPDSHFMSAILAGMLMLDVSGNSTRPDPTVGGKYQERILKIRCPHCADSYGKFMDFGFWDGTRWTCPDDGHEFLLEEPGYWVYAGGHWHIFRQCRGPTSD
jgi:hypothetical protein